MTAKSLHVLLEGLIDYAGLYPPAALSMQDAVRNYARYREGETAWILGRFVVPIDRVSEVPSEFPLTAVGPTPAEALEAMWETKATSPDEVSRIASLAGDRIVFVELSDPALLGELAKNRLRAKIRTGGVVADAFPAIENVAAFLRACRDAGVAFKATAGLHHPLRCVKPLTYEPDAVTGMMHGFLNVFLAAAMLDDAEEILREEDPAAFEFSDGGAKWRDREVSTKELAAMRRDFAISFGSCSFEEPVEELRELGWL